ncbi:MULTISPECIES: hypothetical protein [Morganellaceae]|uniref:Uncharacterized protein n=3 Tax=Morganellaceae TaxID=1903414 RepID=A0A1B8HME3_9GAMM|nr:MULTISPECIES: hypothetical protein [Morganellaceae]QCJ72266.1 hypothetical protein C9446_20935 [Providencia heimbachae]OBU10595.1 hypothetical protein AYY17_15765 [Morganella psychrotolerans]UNH29099.1 hypothetical protein MNY64_16245 [Moellerella wisconsensis]UNH32631.1 hypothetical protein MNY72_16540 [Moellerella wisconsensis]UNH40680.1 hypothetical protein MNY70_17740 [Moellerella wisconsensis]
MSNANGKQLINYLKLIRVEKFPPGICVKALTVFERDTLRVALTMMAHWNNYPESPVHMRPEWAAQVSRLLIEVMKERDELKGHLNRLGLEIPQKALEVSELTYQQILVKCQVG